MTLLQAHSAVPDPHGDRAYADARFVPLEGDVVNQSRTADKPEDESRQTVILTDDASLSIPVTGSARYAVEVFLIVDGDPGAGMSFTLAAPEGSSGSWATMVPGAANEAAGKSLAFGERADIPVSGETAVLSPRGSLITRDASGELSLQWAQTSPGASPLFLRAGSWLRLTRTG